MVQHRKFLRLSDEDNVCVACLNLIDGETLNLTADLNAKITQDIPIGHKIALKQISENTTVLKYGVPIGTATRDIAPGEHVHVHNIRSDYHVALHNKDQEWSRTGQVDDT